MKLSRGDCLRNGMHRAWACSAAVESRARTSCPGAPPTRSGRLPETTLRLDIHEIGQASGISAIKGQDPRQPNTQIRSPRSARQCSSYPSTTARSSSPMLPAPRPSHLERSPYPSLKRSPVPQHLIGPLPSTAHVCHPETVADAASSLPRTRRGWLGRRARQHD
jgi:hypothetical protein